VGQKIYLFGGFTVDAVYLDTICVFNTATGLLTTLDAKLPHGKAYAACALVGKKIYIIGGYKRISTDVGAEFEKAIMVFDTETESLTTLETEFPAYDDGPCCSVLGKEIYVFMGTKTYIYNTEDGTSRSGDEFTRDLRDATAVPYGKKIFIVSGSYTYTNHRNPSSDVYIYDTETQHISVSSNSIPIGRAAAAVAAIGNTLYLFGGEYYSGGKYVKDDIICTLNMDTLETNTLSLTLPAKMSYATAATVGMKLYIFGGDTGTVLKKTILEFSENTPLPSGNMKIRTGTEGPMFSLINTEECKVDMTVKGVYMGNENGLAEVTPAYLYNGQEWTSIWGA
jgi:N-acetylneuraminic acid mutarotase